MVPAFVNWNTVWGVFKISFCKDEKMVSWHKRSYQIFRYQLVESLCPIARAGETPVESREREVFLPLTYLSMCVSTCLGVQAALSCVGSCFQRLKLRLDHRNHRWLVHFSEMKGCLANAAEVDGSTGTVCFAAAASNNELTLSTSMSLGNPSKLLPSMAGR